MFTVNGEALSFVEWPKIARLSRDVIVTEKLDGTNAQIIISDDGTQIAAASRTRLITPQDDNFGFAGWVERNREALLRLGPGRHYGEWWGNGIQRGYGLKEKRFSLFNVTRWLQSNIDAPVYVVPVLYKGMFDLLEIEKCLTGLSSWGSVAAPGFKNPEGVVVFHTASGHSYKKTLDKNDGHKGL